jgi:hypothetical protein
MLNSDQHKFLKYNLKNNKLLKLSKKIGGARKFKLGDYVRSKNLPVTQRYQINAIYQYDHVDAKHPYLYELKAAPYTTGPKYNDITIVDQRELIIDEHHDSSIIQYPIKDDNDNDNTSTLFDDPEPKFNVGDVIYYSGNDTEKKKLYKIEKIFKPVDVNGHIIFRYKITIRHNGILYPHYLTESEILLYNPIM